MGSKIKETASVTTETKETEHKKRRRQREGKEPRSGGRRQVYRIRNQKPDSSERTTSINRSEDLSQRPQRSNVRDGSATLESDHEPQNSRVTRHPGVKEADEKTTLAGGMSGVGGPPGDNSILRTPEPDPDDDPQPDRNIDQPELDAFRNKYFEVQARYMIPLGHLASDMKPKPRLEILREFEAGNCVLSIETMEGMCRVLINRTSGVDLVRHPVDPLIREMQEQIDVHKRKRGILKEEIEERKMQTEVSKWLHTIVRLTDPPQEGEIVYTDTIRKKVLSRTIKLLRLSGHLTQDEYAEKVRRISPRRKFNVQSLKEYESAEVTPSLTNLNDIVSVSDLATLGRNNKAIQLMRLLANEPEETFQFNGPMSRAKLPERTLGDIMRYTTRLQGGSPRTLETELNYTRYSINEFFAGERIPDQDTLNKFIHWLGLSEASALARVMKYKAGYSDEELTPQAYDAVLDDKFLFKEHLDQLESKFPTSERHRQTPLSAGSMVRRERKRRKMTQLRLAQRAVIDRSTVVSTENNRHEPTDAMRYTYAETFQYGPHDEFTHNLLFRTKPGESRSRRRRSRP